MSAEGGDNSVDMVIALVIAIAGGLIANWLGPLIAKYLDPKHPFWKNRWLGPVLGLATGIIIVVVVQGIGHHTPVPSPSPTVSTPPPGVPEFLMSLPVASGDMPQTGLVIIGGQSFPKSLFYNNSVNVATGYSTHFSLTGHWRMLVAWVGIQPDPTDHLVPAGSCTRDTGSTYAVLVDQHQVAEGEVPCGQTHKISVSVAGAHDLNLVFSLAAGATGDFAWADAQLQPSAASGLGTPPPSTPATSPPIRSAPKFLMNLPVASGDMPQTGLVIIGGQSFPKSLFYNNSVNVATGYSTHFSLTGHWGKFVAWVGIQPDPTDHLVPAGSCTRDTGSTYAVLVDQHQVAEGEVPCGQTHKISVSVAGAHDLNLVFNLAAGATGDFAWANAKLQ